MRLITPAICFFILITTTLFSQTDKPELWQKAVAIQAANMDWTPGVMTMTFELLDKHGQPDMTDITSYKITLDDSGETKTEIVKALHNGKDVTEKRKEEMAKEEAKKKNKTRAKKRKMTTASDSVSRNRRCIRTTRRSFPLNRSSRTRQSTASSAPCFAIRCL